MMLSQFDAALSRTHSNNTKATVLASDSYDTMDASSQNSHQQQVGTPTTETWSSAESDDEEQVSTPPEFRKKKGISYPAYDIEQPVFDTKKEQDEETQNNDDTSIAQSFQSFLYNTSFSVSTFVSSPWKEDKPFDEQSDYQESPDKGKRVETKVEATNSVDAVARGTSKGSNESTDSSKDMEEDDNKVPFLKQEIEIPMNVAYILSGLVIFLCILGVIIALKLLADAEALASTAPLNQVSPSGSFVLEPTLSPTTSPSNTKPTFAPTVKISPTNIPASPTKAPVVPTPPPVQCSNEISIDRNCYLLGNDSIEVDFTSCETKTYDWVGVYLEGNNGVLGHQYMEWSWSCGTKNCGSSPKANVFKLDSSTLPLGTYRVYHMRYDPAGAPYRSTAKSSVFSVAPQC